MSRLERLVSLLDTGSSVYVRQAAAEQLAEIQRSHPEELYKLLGRVVPFLSQKKWDTRTAAAKALTLVTEAVHWAPNDELKNEIKSEVKDEIKDEIKVEIKDEIKVEVKDEMEVDSQDTDTMAFAGLDLTTVLLKGTALLGSAGKEFDMKMASMDAAERLKSQQQTLKRQLGFGADLDDSADLLADEDLELEPRPRKKAKSVQIKAEPKAEPQAAPKTVENARMRAMAKRRQKMGGAKEAKIADAVKVEFKKDPAVEMAELLAVQPGEWPFKNLCEHFKANMFCPQWESRHGALIGLRAVLVSHGAGGGTCLDVSVEENRQKSLRWLEDLACRLCCVLALDRFADYVADEVVAPVRESCAQVLGAVLVYLTHDIAAKLFDALVSLVRQQNLDQPIWTARHGGMLGLLYFVTVNPSFFDSNPEAFSQLIDCSLNTLEHSDDDDVQAIAAATLRPVCNKLVDQKPELVPRLLNVVWSALENLKDDLSSFIGRVMDLLAELCSNKAVMEILAKDGSLPSLIPRLYPFLRHSITDVRKAVLRSLGIFLEVAEGEGKKWITAHFARLLLQNIILEQNEQVAKMSIELWQRAMKLHPETLAALAKDIWTPLFKLYITPVGTARRAYKMDPTLLLKPNGEPFDKNFHDRANCDSNSNCKVYIDGPVIAGDVLIVDADLVMRNRISAAVALAELLSLLPNNEIAEIVPSLCEMGESPLVSRKLFVIILLAEYGRSCEKPSPELLDAVIPRLTAGLETPLDVVYRDINPVLRAVRTQCQSLFSLMVSEGGLPSSAVPSLPQTIEGDSGADSACFGLVQAEEFGNKVFDELKQQLSPEVQVGMAQTLSEGRENLLAAISEAREQLEKSNRNVRAQSAVAYVALSRTLPAKQGPIIRALMDSVKTETNTLLRDRVAESLCDFYVRLCEGSRASAAEKIVKNLCSFLCVDVDEAPVFRMHKESEQGIMSLKRDETNFQSIGESLRREKETLNSHIKRRGALAALAKITKHNGMQVSDPTKELNKSMFASLNLLTEKEDYSDLEGQAIIDNLAVTRALIPLLDPSIYGEIEKHLPLVEKALFSKYAVLRFVAAKCFSTACKHMPSRAMLYFVKNILPQVNGNALLSNRQGALEATYHIMMTMGEQALPYIVYFLVPTMGRMSDSDIGMRTIAATTFASIIKLVPLEQGVQDPPDMPAELLEGRDAERKLIQQMMDVSKIEPFKLPITVKAELRSYQQDGVNWLAFLNRYHLHGVLCDDMGLGKTLQTICIVASDHYLRAEKLKADDQNKEYRKLPSLIVCPTSLTGHWVQEFKKYVPHIKTLAYVGAPTVRSSLVSAIGQADVVITSYDIARNDVSALSAFDYNYHVLDEGHIIKNANSKLARAIKQYSSEHRLVLSGTPIQNNVLELWSLFDFLMPGFLGNEKSFNERFSKPIIASKSGRSSTKDKEAASLALEALHKQVLPFLLRRLKEEVLDDLPPKIIQDYYCDLNDRQVALYNEFTKAQKEVVADELKESSASAKKHVFQALMYMRRLCNHPALVTHTKDELTKLLKGKLDYAQSPKLLALQQLLKDCGIGDVTTNAEEIPEAASQHRALIFCQQKDMLDLVENSLLRKNMPSVSYMRMDGSVAGQDRQEMVAKFNDDPSIDVLLLSTHVGGLGLNLTGADTVIFVEHDWNPMNDLQAMDRAHRIGQKKVVNVYRLITRNTLEERIMGLQEFKMNIASTVINQQNSGLGSMNTDQILDLFSANDEIAPAEKAEPESTEADKLMGKEPAGLTELWDENEYAEEYNLDNFIKNLKGAK